MTEHSAPLVFVRKTRVFPVPPVCHVAWTEDDWQRTSRVVVEPLVLDMLGFTWVADGTRDRNGKLMYRLDSPSL